MHFTSTLKDHLKKKILKNAIKIETAITNDYFLRETRL